MTSKPIQLSRAHALHLTLPYPPTANHLTANVGRFRVASKEAKAYKHTAGWLAKEQGAVMLEGPLVANLDFYRPRKVGDLDNCIKVVLDALSGIAFKDDKQVVEIHARRFEDKSNPRVEVQVAAKE